MIMLSVFLAMSVLQAIWGDRNERLQQPLPETKMVRGLKSQGYAEGAFIARSRSPRRRSAGVKAMLQSWAKGESSAVAVSRLAHAIVTEDGADAGIGMSRLAGLASMTSSSDKNCSSKLVDLLSLTSLDKMVRPVPHAKK